jgi:hypothetical protein
VDVGPLCAQRCVGEQMLVRVCVLRLRGRVGRIGARRCVAEEAVCETPWGGAGERGKEGF